MVSKFKLIPPCALELTFAMIKPSFMKVPLILQTIQEEILMRGFYVVASKDHILNQNDIRSLYEEHMGKPFYHRLTSYMTSGSVRCFILSKENAIQEWRDMLGPTSVYKSQYTHGNLLRGKFGLSDTRNVGHGSDSPESAEREAKIFFPHFSCSEWYKSEEIYFRNGFIDFNEDEFIHIPLTDWDTRQMFAELRCNKCLD